MADTRRDQDAILALFANNAAGAISAQDLRDFVVSVSSGYGTIYNTTTIQTVISSQSTWTPVLGTTTLTNANQFDMPSAGQLRYIGSPDVHVHVSCSVGTTSQNNNVDLLFRLGLNGVATGTNSVASEIPKRIGSGGDLDAVALHFDATLSTNDYVSLFVSNESGTGNVTVFNLHITAETTFV